MDDICNFATTLDGLRESLKCTLNYCQANRLRVNLRKSCYTVFNAPSSTPHPALAITGQLLRYDLKPCYLGVCLSDNKAEQNSIMLQKASRATYALRSMIDSTIAATVVNKLFEQLIEPILLYAIGQWLPYIHPRKVDKSGPIDTFSTPSSQLPMEDAWKKFIYPHYSLNESTPVLAVRAKFGSYPTFVAGISRLAKYMPYIIQEAPPLPWSVRPSSPKKLLQPKPNTTGGPTHGVSLINSRPRNLTRLIFPLNVSKMRSDPNTAAGGFNT